MELVQSIAESEYTSRAEIIAEAKQQCHTPARCSEWRRPGIRLNEAREVIHALGGFLVLILLLSPRFSVACILQTATHSAIPAVGKSLALELSDARSSPATYH